MKVIKDVSALYQAAAGIVNQYFYTGKALGVRIVPNTTGNIGNLWPRGLIIEDSRENQNIDLNDSSWYVIQRDIKQSAYFGTLTDIQQGTDNPLAHTTGPAVKMRFNVDQVGSNASDLWDVYIAEDLVDVLTPLEQSGNSFTRDASSGLYFPQQSTASGQISVVVQGGSIGIQGQDGQIFDQTAGAGAAINSGTIGSAIWRDYVVRVSGLSAPTTRTLTLNMVRTDASTVPLFISPAIGATVTDLILAIGQGANVGATPLGSTSLGMNFAGPVSSTIQVNLSAGGADTPRMTIVARAQS